MLWLIHAFGDSSRAFEPLFETDLACDFELFAPDWPGAGGAVRERVDDFADLAVLLAANVERLTPGVPLGFVGHSLGAAVGARAVGRVERVVGLFSIEGNLTHADAYFSGLATEFDVPEEFRGHLLARIRELADTAAPSRRDALLRYRASLSRADAQTLWKIGRAASSASRENALGEEYLALPVPTLYHWSPENTPHETQAFIRDHRLRDVVVTGGHWPMVEQPDATARLIRGFFQPLFASIMGSVPRLRGHENGEPRRRSRDTLAPMPVLKGPFVQSHDGEDPVRTRRVRSQLVTPTHHALPDV